MIHIDQFIMKKYDILIKNYYNYIIIKKIQMIKKIDQRHFQNNPNPINQKKNQQY